MALIHLASKAALRCLINYNGLLEYLSGNMWAQSWDGIETLLRPFPNKVGVDITDELQRQVRIIRKLEVGTQIKVKVNVCLYIEQYPIRWDA